MKQLISAATIVALCSGCASVVNESTAPVRVETKTEAGDLVAGAECTLSNDYGMVKSKSGEVVLVHRSGKDLDIVCKHPNNPDAFARAISRANGGMFGNILLGGGIGAIVDHNNGKAYTYPSWVQLVFGQTLTFDRSGEKEGTPVAAVTTSKKPDAAASAAAEPKPVANAASAPKS